MRKSKILIPILILLVVLLSVVILVIRKREENNFNDYYNNDKSDVSQNITDSDNRAEQFEKTGLNLSEVEAANITVLKEYGLSLTDLTERDFYFNGTYWDAIVLSNTNIPYKVVIYKDYTISIELDMPDGEESDV